MTEKKDKTLLEWYQEMAAGGISTPAASQITLPPVGDSVTVSQTEIKVADDTDKVELPAPPNSDPVVIKDNNTSLRAFVYSKRIQDLLVRLAGLVEPYEKDSEERQKTVDEIKDFYKKLGEDVAKL